jgi:hypothetical protein
MIVSEGEGVANGMDNGNSRYLMFFKEINSVPGFLLKLECIFGQGHI